jgi:hypothetical protein
MTAAASIKGKDLPWGLPSSFIVDRPRVQSGEVRIPGLPLNNHILAVIARVFVFDLPFLLFSA